MKMPTISLTSERSVVAPAATMPNLVRRQSPKTTTHSFGESFRHPEDFPLEVRTSLPWKAWFNFYRSPEPHQVKLKFFSGVPYKVGANIRITIPLRHKNNHFDGRVIHLAPLRIGYEVNITLLSSIDSERLRIVERICTLESELQRSIVGGRH